MGKNKQYTDDDWIEAIKSSIINNNKSYTTVPWMQLETGKPAKKVMYELQKLVIGGKLIRISSNRGVWYKLNNPSNKI